MDKNFIKVDDLFRQRLGDGEERERSGAWLNMRELLDKEMPQQKRIGAFYWRRLFSAVAALSLIGTVCVSSYELSAAFRNRAVSDVIPEVPVSVNGEPARTLSMAKGDREGAKDVRGVRRIEATREGDNSMRTGDENATPSNNGNKVSAPATAANESTIRSLNNNNNNNNSNNPNVVSANNETIAATQPITIDANVHSGDVINNKKAKAANKAEAAKQINRAAGSAGGANAIASNTVDNGSGTATRHSSEKRVRTGDNTSAQPEKDEQTLATGNAVSSARGAHHNTGDAASLANNGNETSLHHNRLAEGEEAKKHGTSAHNAVASKAHRTHTDARNNAKSERNPATAGNAVPAATAAHGDRVASKGGRPSRANLPGATHKTSDMALNSATTSATGNKSTKDAHVASNSDELHKLASENINKLAAADIATMGKTGVSQPKGTTLDIPSAVAEDANDGGTAHKKAADANPSLAKGNQKETGAPTEQSIHDQPSAGKKVITKLVVHERTFKVADNEYELRSDTISKERIVMDMNEKNEPAVAKPAATEEAPAAVSNKRVRKRLFGHKNAGVTASTPGMAGTSAPAQHKSGTPAMGSNSGASSALVASAGASAAGNANESELAPAASASAKSSSSSEIVPAAAAEAAKAKATESKHKGLSMVKKLALAFNDVKNNASRTTFAPGLTAGVNSYFFGPSSLKGFQLGLTGDIIFNDSWNVMTELKYFHRVNNNTSIQDNYYSYTPVGTQYLKQLQLNSYSFSALHSLEMPVAVRYHMGNFNFYAGGNFLYAFSINTGATAMPSYATAAEYVNAPGTDDKGALSEADFKSRFGLGYLFGFSYNLSHNFSLDLRNVQTVWDNAATTGAKSISTQLYKTPSIQLSVMYRLGGNRSKD